MNSMHLAIAGGGAAGLAMALCLKRAGHRLTLLEAPRLFSRIAALGQRINRLCGADALTGKTVLDLRYDALRGGRQGIAVHRAASG